MKLERYLYDGGWDKPLDNSLDSENTLILLFSSSDVESVKKPLAELVDNFENSVIMGASGAGQIFDDQILDSGVIVVVTKFESTKIKKVSLKIEDMKESYGMGKMMKETLSLLPQDVQTDIKSLIQGLEPKDKKDAMMQMNEIETSNMTVEDLTTAIMDLFQPTQSQTKSSFPGSFSVYA